MTQRPLIGVTTSEVRLAEDVQRAAHGEPPRPDRLTAPTHTRRSARPGASSTSQRSPWRAQPTGAGCPSSTICRGAQALNVARRGTLFQHLPESGGEVDHRPGDYGHDVAHSVEIEPDSLLADALGATRLDVPSYHHQAADELGRELRAVAWSPDGIVEGIEAVNKGFAIGVQWHAEGETPENGRFFRSFVRAAQRHAAARAEPEPAFV
jgi:anthranilate/para-aminobenzoate synthase component II